MPVYDIRHRRPGAENDPFEQLPRQTVRGSIPFPPWPPHCRERCIVDATGAEISSCYVQILDTDGGWVIMLDVCDGVFQIDPITKRAATKQIRMQPPLELLPYAEELTDPKADIKPTKVYQ